MRNYLFRGKEAGTKKWIYGAYCEHSAPPVAIGDPGPSEHLIIKDGMSDWNLPRPIVCFLVIKETVDQYTGFDDKDKKNIFGGDIVFISGREHYADCYAEVDFRYGGWYVSSYDDENMLMDVYPFCEVVGNIHDNMELLKEERGKL
jgi:hypothetical protein